MPVLNQIGDTRIDPNSSVKMRADVCINPLGVFNRLNPSQLVEQMLNYILMVTRYRMEECDTIEEARDLMLEVIKEIDSYAVNENYKVYSEYLNSIEGKELEEVIYEYIEKGIPMKMEPFFRNVNMYNLSEVAEKFNIVEGKDDRIDTPLIIAPIYYIRLKHQPSGKFSAKSIDSNNMTDLPAKTKDKKNSISPISNTPIKLGGYFAA